MSSTALVMGGSGFLGSHITRQLVQRGDTVRVWTRATSATRGFAGLPVEHCVGELEDAAALRAAMRGAEVVHYCIVDTRPGLRDPAPLFRTNVEGLRHALDAAVEVGVPKFVFCSTVGTIGGAEHGAGDEELPHDWAHLGGPYIKSRLDAEELVLHYVREHALPAVVMCVGTTFGPHDHGPSAHGRMVEFAALGKMPGYVKGAVLEMVGVEDAARAFLLAAEHGRVGERYIVSERLLTFQHLLTVAARATGAPPPRVGLPMGLVRLAGALGDLAQLVLRRDVPITSVGVRLMHLMPALDHGKAERELGWRPAPAEEGIEAAARWFAHQHELAQGSETVPGAPGGRPRGDVLRSLATAAVVLLWMGLVAGWFSFTSAGGDDNGRIWAVGAYLPAAVATGAIWVRHPRRWFVVAAVALLAITAGIATADRAPAASSVLARALDDVHLPSGARLLGQESRDVGIGSGTELTRWVAVPSASAAAASAFRAALVNQGFTQNGAGLDAHGRWVRGRIAVVFRAGAKDLYLGGVPGDPAPTETVLYVVAASG